MHKGNKIGVAGMVLGIIGLPFSLIPFFGALVAIPCVAIGLPLSGAAFYQSRKLGTPIGILIVAWVTNAMALVLINVAGNLTALFLLWSLLSGWES